MSTSLPVRLRRNSHGWPSLPYSAKFSRRRPTSTQNGTGAGGGGSAVVELKGSEAGGGCGAALTGGAGGSAGALGGGGSTGAVSPGCVGGLGRLTGGTRVNPPGSTVTRLGSN